MTPFDLASRFIGELPERADGDHPFIVWGHELCRLDVTTDEVPWCSSFVNAICWMLRVQRSKSAAARSWLSYGVALADLSEAQPGYDIVVLKRGISPLAGHVGFYAGREWSAAGESKIHILGGNQGDNVSIARFPAELLLGTRRLKPT